MPNSLQPAFFVPILDFIIQQPRPTHVSTTSSAQAVHVFTDFHLCSFDFIELNTLLGLYIHLLLPFDVGLADRRRLAGHHATTALLLQTQACHCSVHCAGLGAPSLIDVVELFPVIVELGYDRRPAVERQPATLVNVEPVAFAADLRRRDQRRMNSTTALISSPAPRRSTARPATTRSSRRETPYGESAPTESQQRLDQRLSPGDRRQTPTSTPTPKLDRLTDGAAGRRTLTRRRRNCVEPTAIPKDKAGTTTTDNSLTTTDLALPSASRPQRRGKDHRETGQPVHARVHNAGADAKRTTTRRRQRRDDDNQTPPRRQPQVPLRPDGSNTHRPSDSDADGS